MASSDDDRRPPTSTPRQSVAPTGGTVVIALPRPVPRATHVRGTLLLSSLHSLRHARHHAAYMRALPVREHDAILSLTGATWLPLALAEAHYAACDTLGLREDDVVRLGDRVSQVSQGTLLSTFVKGAKGADVSPLTLFAQVDRMYSRAWQGSAMGVTSVGPKELRVEVVGNPCARFHYFRHGLRGMASNVAGLLSRTCHVRERRGTGAEHVVISVAWE